MTRVGCLCRLVRPAVIQAIQAARQDRVQCQGQVNQLSWVCIHNKCSYVLGCFHSLPWYN